MAAEYTYEPGLALDQITLDPARGAVGRLVGPDGADGMTYDLSSTPDQPLPKPIVTNNEAYYPGFKADTPTALLYFGESATPLPVTSIEVRDSGLEAVGAKAAAEEARDAAQAAQTAAETEVASTAQRAAEEAVASATTTIRAEVDTSAKTVVPGMVVTELAKNPAPAQAAAAAVSAEVAANNLARANDTVDMLVQGAKADGTTDDMPTFVAARTKAGPRGVVHFPARPGQTETTYYLGGARPNLAGTQIRTDPSVILRMDEDPNTKEVNYLTPVRIAHTNGRTFRKESKAAMPLAAAAAANVHPQRMDLRALNFDTAYTAAAWTVGVTPGTPATAHATLTANGASWTGAAGIEAVVVTAPVLGSLYEVLAETTATTATAGAWVGPMAASADNHLGIAQVFQDSLVPRMLGGSAFIPATGALQVPTADTHRMPLTSGGIILGFRLTSARTIEFYLNGLMVHRVTAGKDIDRAGFAINPAAAANTTLSEATVKHGFQPKSARPLTITVIGDSTAYGAWNDVPWPDLLPISLAGLPGGGIPTSVTNLGVSSTTAAQWGTAGGAHDVAAKSFVGSNYVLVMLGTNDGQALASKTDFLTHLGYIAAKIVADGARPVFGVFPHWVNSTISGVPGVATTNPTRAARLRAALTRWAASNGYPIADVNDAFGTNWTGYADNIHPYGLGSVYYAHAFAQAISRDRMPAA